MTTDLENWQRLQALFHLAADAPDTEIDSVLLSAEPDPAIRLRAKALVLAAKDTSPDPVPGLPSWSGERVGPYQIIRHLGSGGIGAVYLVERVVGGAIQRAALKVLSLQAAGSFFTERFRREQHILSSLDHPHITRLLDAGLTETGSPYLVMEYVNGPHIDAYCDQHGLTVADRLTLFLDVCDAVSYAHRNLIVHLDLKPSNILVTEAEGTVKLLDFGTSKLIQQDSLLTTTVMATPAYASPEQLRNEPVTTACDVYSLGAMLFELLAGRRPNADRSVAVMLERSFREEPAEPLFSAVSAEAAQRRGSTVARLRNELHGDLTTVVGKCLSARPKDRYGTVEALVTDLQRYLAGRPVLARPQTTWYRFAKFVRRNRTSVVATAAALLLLCASIGFALWRQHESMLAGQRALRMQTFMYRLFKLANSNYTAKPAATVPEFLELGVKVLPEFIRDPADRRAAQLSLAESMFDNGDLPHAREVFTSVAAEAKAAGDLGALAEAEGFAGNIAYTLGDMKNGEALSAHALALSRHREVSASARVWIEIFYAANRENNGFRSDDNVKLLQDAVEQSRKQRLPDRETAFALYSLASDYEERGRLDEAEQLINQSIAIYNGEPYAICDQSEMFADLAYIHGARGDTQGSLPLYKRAYDGLKTCSGPDNHTTLTVQDYMAGAMIKLGQAKEAIPMLETSMPAWRKLVGSSPELTNPLIYLARAYVETGDYQRAEQASRELVGLQEGKVDPKSTRWAVSQLVWAQSLAGLRRYNEALPHAQLADQILAASPSTPSQKQTQAQAHTLLAQIASEMHTPTP